MTRKRRRHTAEQIIKKLRAADAMITGPTRRRWFCNGGCATGKGTEIALRSIKRRCVYVEQVEGSGAP